MTTITNYIDDHCQLTLIRFNTLVLVVIIGAWSGSEPLLYMVVVVLCYIVGRWFDINQGPPHSFDPSLQRKAALCSIRSVL